jgi:hypothetical protein
MVIIEADGEKNKRKKAQILTLSLKVPLQFCHCRSRAGRGWVKISSMTSFRKDSIIVISVILLVLGLISLPYLVAARAVGQDYVFGGFLFNPLDGNTYLAKMYEGWRGEWRFTLPYTADPGKGAYLFLFYLSLGHISRLFNLSLPFMYHTARLLCSTLMLLALYQFFTNLLHDRRAQLLAFILAALGSGLGWLAAMFGSVTSDFWVAEAYPFLSAFATPHFALGLAVLLFLLVESIKWDLGKSAGGLIRILLLSLTLSIVAPFGVVIALTVLGVLLVWEVGLALINRPAFGSGADGVRRLPSLQVASQGRLLSIAENFMMVLAAGAPFLIYDLWAASTDPILAGWNTQNLTPAPRLWDLIISMSPTLIIAGVGVWEVFKYKTLGGRLLVAWAVAGLVLLYAPFGLQRRFMMGLFVPLAGLGALGLMHLAGGSRRRALGLGALLLFVSLPTSWLVLLSAQHGIQTREPLLYLSRGEEQALNWLEHNTPVNALVLTGPETGLFIPAQTGRRVLFGHPFETVNAGIEKANVTEYFLNGGASPPLATQFPVDYVLVGPREQKLGEFTSTAGLQVVYQANGVTIYAIER